MSAHDVKYPLAQRLLYIVFSLRVRVLLMFRLETPSPIVSPRTCWTQRLEFRRPVLALPQYEK